MKNIKMNYKVSLFEMDKMALMVNLKKIGISVEGMRMQAQNLKDKSISNVKKNHHWLIITMKSISPLTSKLKELRVANTRLDAVNS